jgi:hypothetical protein
MSITNVPFFSPTSITGCSFWFDATDSSTITLSSGSLTQWNDKSVNGKNFTAVSGFANATVSSAFQNGLNVFNFSGNGLYRTPLGSAVYPQDAYVIVALKTTASHVDVLGMGDSTTDNFNSLTFAENVAKRWQNGSSGGGRLIYSPTDETSTSFLLMQWSIANGNFLLRRNGTQLVQGSQSYGFSSPSTAILQIGYRHADTTYGTFANFNGYIGEIAVFNSQLGTTDRQNIESYLTQKWGLTAGLPAGHPGLTSTVYKAPTQAIQVTPYTSVSYAFAPTQITGCQLWLDGADSSTLTFSGNNLITWKDKSANNYSFAGSGAIWSNVGPSGNSNLYFNGSSSTSYLGTCALSQPYTIFVSAYQTTNTGSYQRILNGNCAAEQSGDQDLLFVGCLGTSLAVFNGLGVNTWNDVNANSPATNTLNTWMVTTATISGTNLTTYAYGSQLDSKNGAYTPSNVIALRISGGYYGGAVQQPWNGYIGEVIIYSGVLSSQQRQQIEGYLAQKWSSASSLSNASLGKSVTYFLHQSMVTRAATTTPSPASKIPINLTGLIIYYSFDNAIFDLYNLTSLSLTGSFSYVTGRRGQAISLTNTAGVAPTNYLSSSYVLPSVFTISLWFQTPNVSNGSMVFCANSNVSLANGSISIYFTGGNLFCAYSDVVNNATAFAISANTWYHTVLTYNSGSTTLYVNGSQSGNTITGTNSKNGFTFGGGRDTLTQYPFSGYIDEFRIYSRILTSTEITAIYNNLG